MSRVWYNTVQCAVPYCTVNSFKYNYYCTMYFILLYNTISRNIRTSDKSDFKTMKSVCTGTV